MHTIEERREELCAEICDFRDRLLEKFGEEEVYTSLLWISSLMYLSSSTNLLEGKMEAFRAAKASYKEELDRRNKEILLKAKASMECSTTKSYLNHKHLYLIKK
jgi:hypothetical protein